MSAGAEVGPLRGSSAVCGRRHDARHLGCAEITVASDGGRRIRRYIYGKTQREVRERLQGAREDVRRGIAPTPQRLTLAACLAEWLETVRSTVRATTFVSYEGHVRLHIVPSLGRVPLVKLSPTDVRRLIALRLESGASPRWRSTRMWS